MTKLPKSLEIKLRQQVDACWNETQLNNREKHMLQEGLEKGCKSGALEVKAIADRKLVEALDAAQSELHMEFCGTEHHPVCIAASSALAEWAAFWEGK